MSLTNEQYNSIMREYDEMRQKSVRESEEKVRGIYEKYPELKAWENRAITLKVQQSKAAMDGASREKLDEIGDEITMLLVRRQSLLESTGLTDKDFEPEYECEECKDTGYITDGAGVRRKCRCFIKREMEILYDQSGIRSLLQRENFSKLTYDHRSGDDLDHLKNAVAICRKFVDDFDSEYKNILFLGTVGTGKSFLSCCVAHELLESCHSVIYMSAIQLFERLADSRFGNSKDESREDNENIYGCDLLIIDDLGTELSNSFVASELFGLINERNLKRRSTIISTNLSLEDINDRYSERVLSRLTGRTGNYMLIELTGRDARQVI